MTIKLNLDEEKMKCKIKGKTDLSEWERRKLSEEFRAMAMAYNLDYIIVIN